jgi:hypothetical protein
MQVGTYKSTTPLDSALDNRAAGTLLQSEFQLCFLEGIIGDNMGIFTPTKLKLIYFSNEFPHDDLQSLLHALHKHSRDRRHPVLARFLEEATLVVREEIRQLPTALRALIPPFETVLDFSDFADLRRGQLCGAIDGILLCTVELATIIG